MKAWMAGLALIAAALEAPACSAGDTPEYRYETLEGGAQRLVRTVNMGSAQNPLMRTDTVGVYRPSDLEARLRGFLQDSALVFIGRFDSLSRDSVNIPSPLVALDTLPFSPSYTAYYRLQVDTVLRGVFPHPRTVWVRLREGAGSCTVPFNLHLNRSFLNASSGFSIRPHLKMTFDPFPSYDPFPEAFWFTGRYLYDPTFPDGLRLDITRVLADYPATSITPRRPAFARPATSGRTYLPNGRASALGQGRKPAMPLLRKEAR